MRRAYIKGGSVLVCQFSYDANLVERIKTLDSRKWDKENKWWTLKITLDSIAFILENGFDIAQKDIEALYKTADKLIAADGTKSEKYRIAKSTEASPIPEVAKLFKLQPYSYQWVPAHYFNMCGGRMYLGDDMALGKSVQSLVVSKLDAVRDRPKIIVTPVPYTYQDEIKKFLGEPSLVMDKNTAFLHPRIKYYLITYERLKYLFQDADKLIPKTFIKDCLLIFDEAHKIKNRQAQRTRYAKALALTAPYLLLMSGTPVMNRTDELYEPLSMIDPDFMPWGAFMKKFCGMTHGTYGVNTSGNTNSAKLNNWLFSNVMVRREKFQVASQLPEKIRQSILLRDVPVEVWSDSVLGMYSESAKQKAEDPEFLSWIKLALENSPKVGLFAHHHTMMDALEGLCRELGYGYVRIDGNDKDQEERHKKVIQFQDDPNCRVAILSDGCAAQGLNGLQVAQLCIITEFPWTPGLLEQAENRFHRPGLAGDLLVLYPIFSNFDYSISQLLLAKIGVIRRVVGVEVIPDSIDSMSLQKMIAKEYGIPIHSSKKGKDPSKSEVKL